MNCSILLITPPLMQLNAVYPAMPILAGYLRAAGRRVVQVDASLELFLRLFSRSGLEGVRRAWRRTRPAGAGDPSVWHFLEHFAPYAETIDAVVRFLQGREPELAARIVTRRFLPEGPRFKVIADWDRAMSSDARGPASPWLAWHFGDLGAQDQATYLASLYVDDLADAVRLGVDERFELSRYAEGLALSLPVFEPVRAELERRPTAIDRLIDELATDLVATHHPAVAGFTIPFPGNLYAALRMARAMKRADPDIRIVCGGGYVNTELRSLSDPGIFDYVDFITLDDGDLPLRRLIEHVEGASADRLVRTFVRREGQVVFVDDARAASIASPPSVPDYEGLALDRRVGMTETPNAVHSLWSHGRWNKLALAHGCYWRRCAFCDTSLDYIRRYRPRPAGQIVDQLEAVIKQSGRSGFHFVDEAAPPALLRGVAGEVKRRGLAMTWWGNIRFEKSFTPVLAKQLAESGCLALAGGLETVCNRTLAVMGKGITVEQAVVTAGRLASEGILLHAYLMYGFPSQTRRETIEALEIVRQMFAVGCLHSAYWHRFALTVHSPMAARPDDFGIRLLPAPPAPFAQNEIPFEDLSGAESVSLAPGLRRATYNFLHGAGFERDVREWFDEPVPRPRVPRRYVERLCG